MADIKLKDIREQYIIPALSNLGYRFKIFSTIGAYVKVREFGRLREGIINTLLQVTETDIIQLGGDFKASAVNVTLSFLLPVPDTVTEATTDGYGGEWDFVEKFRDEIASTFATTDKLVLTSGGKTYVGGVTGSFPTTGELLVRQGIGQSVEYVCYLQFTYLAGGVNSRDVQFYLDGGEAIPYTRFMIARKNTVSSALLSNSTNGEAVCYAESSSFGVDLSLPAIDTSNPTGLKIFNYLMGLENDNEPHTLVIKYGQHSIERTVIFGEASNEGETVQNVAAKISFIPYMQAEDA